MPKITLVLDGQRGKSLEGYASLAGMSPEELILKWIANKLDYAAIAAMRAAGATWEAVAEELKMSITQARRIYASEGETPPISKEDLRRAEKYLEVLNDVKEITEDGVEFPVPTEEEVDMLKKYYNELPDADDIHFPIPNQDDLDMIGEYCNALPDEDNIHFPIPTEGDLDALREYNKLRGRK